MQNSYFPLNHYEFIRISGGDSISFLQGQLSCNTELLSDSTSLSGALCNLKGRVIADFRLLQHGEDILMQCAEGMAGKIIATLKKYAVFSKVEFTLLENQSDCAPIVLGIMGESVNEALSILGLELPEIPNGVSSSADTSVVRIAGSGARVELWLHTQAAAKLFPAAAETEGNTNIEPWLSAEIEAGILHITPSLSEEFTPQLVNYDLSGLIDFKKGCYTGQEIVARMFYRSTAKRRLQIASSSEPISSSSKVLAGSNKDLEEDVLAFSNTGGVGPVLLAILPVEIADSGENLTLSDNADAILSIRALPYSAE